MNEEAQTANAGVLLWELEKMGITRDDARLKPIIEKLRRLRRLVAEINENLLFLAGRQSSLKAGRRFLERTPWPPLSLTFISFARFLARY